MPLSSPNFIIITDAVGAERTEHWFLKTFFFFSRKNEDQEINSSKSVARFTCWMHFLDYWCVNFSWVTAAVEDMAS